MSPSKSRFDPNYAVLLRELIKVRSEAGFSQTEVANSLGFTQSTWSKIETGERRLDVIELRRFCAAVDKDFLAFISSVERMME